MSQKKGCAGDISICPWVQTWALTYMTPPQIPEAPSAWLLPFSEKLDVAKVADIFEAGFNKFLGFLYRLGSG